jgi:hypothetical protein
MNIGLLYDASCTAKIQMADEGDDAGNRACHLPSIDSNLPAYTFPLGPGADDVASYTRSWCWG